MPIDSRPALWNGIEVPYERSIDELVVLIDGPAPLQWAAFVALAHKPGELALAALRDRTASPDPYVRRMAVECIGIRPDGSHLRETVCALLSDANEFVVRAACEAAARLRITEAHQVLLRLLDADDHLVREAALRALRPLWNQTAFDRVVRIFVNDPSAEVRKEAAWTLRSAATAQNWNVLFELWRPDSQPRHRAWACDLAAAFATHTVIASLETLAQDPDGHVRSRASAALLQIHARND